MAHTKADHGTCVLYDANVSYDADVSYYGITCVSYEEKLYRGLVDDRVYDGPPRAVDLAQLLFALLTMSLAASVVGRADSNKLLDSAHETIRFCAGAGIDFDG